MNQTYFEFAIAYRTVINADRNDLKIAKGQVAFLAALVNANDQKGTLDDATADLATAFDDNGKWRGAITLQLSLDGLIAEVGATNSRRLSRRRGLLRRWRLVDAGKARRKIESLKRWIDETESPRPGATGTGIESTTTATPKTEGIEQCG